MHLSEVNRRGAESLAGREAPHLPGACSQVCIRGLTGSLRRGHHPRLGHIWTRRPSKLSEEAGVTHALPRHLTRGAPEILEMSRNVPPNFSGIFKPLATCSPGLLRGACAPRRGMAGQRGWGCQTAPPARPGPQGPATACPLACPRSKHLDMLARPRLRSHLQKPQRVWITHL